MATTAVVPFDLSKLQLARRNVVASMPPPLGFLRMDKQGTWCHGAESIEVDPNAQFAVNMASFQRGYVAWADTDRGAPSAKLDERMYPAFDDLPEAGEPPKGSRGWENQLGFNLKSINATQGTPVGLELQYRASSDGGRRAIAALIEEVATGAADNPGKMPIVKLESRSYKHKSYGKIFAPVITIVKWATPPSDPKGKVAPAKNPPKK